MERNDWRDLIDALRGIRAELRGIRLALEAANAADPVQALAAALSDRPQDESPAGSPPGAPEVPPEERWRLR